MDAMKERAQRFRCAGGLWSGAVLAVVIALAPATALAAGQSAGTQPQPATPAQATTQSQPGTQSPPATQAQPTQPAQGQASAGRVFGSDAGMIFNQIKPDKTADFEMVIDRLREALQKSENPVRRQQAAGWRVFKSVEPGPNGSVLYVFWVNPAVKGEDYTVSKILAEAFPQEAQQLYQTYVGAYAGGQNLVNLQLVATLGSTADQAQAVPNPPPPQR
jgi:hypothetical protein